MMRFSSLEFFRDKIRDDELSDIVNDWRWVFSYAGRYRWQIILFTLLGIAGATFSLVSSVSNKFMVDIVTGHKTEMLWLLVTIWIGTNGLSLLMDNGYARCSARVTIAIQRDVQQDVFRRILGADWIALQRYSNGELLDRINGDTSTVSGNAISWAPGAIITGYSFLATFAVIWHYSKGMTLIAIAGAPVLFLVRRAFLIREREYYRGLRQRSSRIYTHETESFTRMDTIKSMGLANRFTDIFDDAQAEMQDYALKKNTLELRRVAVMRILRMIVSVIAFSYALWLLWGGRITYGTMVLFLQQRGRLTEAMMNLGSIISEFVNCSVSAHRVIELMELPQERGGGTPEETVISGKITLQLSDIQFAYKNDIPVIRGGEFVVSRGEIVALVGPTGCGKTTLLRMMLGLVQPDCGVCELRDGDGNAVETNADTRKLFAYVPQGNSLFSGTIAENLRMMDESAGDDEIMHALKMADAWEFVKDFPEGIEHKVGENGRGLSEGQAQRIAIARALLRKAPVLFLDEATSALDADTEAKVLLNLKQEAKDHAVVITTHRASVLQICDRVYKMKDGQVRRS